MVDIALQTETLSIVESFNVSFTVRKLTKFTSRYNVTFSTTPLKCCHFTLQNMKRDKIDKLIIHQSYHLQCNVLLFGPPCSYVLRHPVK